MEKLKLIFKDVRVIVLLVMVALSIFAVRPSFSSEDRLAIRNIIPESAADLAGMEPPAEGTLPRGRDVLLSINDQPVHTLPDYYDTFAQIQPNTTVTVATENARFPYRLTAQPIINQTVIGNTTELVNVTNTTINQSTNETMNVTTQVEQEVPVIDGSVIGTEELGMVLYPAPASNIRLGLDLEGGVRVMLEPEEQVSQDDMSLIIDSLKQRLNVYGLSDTAVRSASDLEGNQFVIVEIPGASEEEVRNLIGEQGRFEARIGDEVAFTGGDDIRHVCRTADCSGLSQQGCGRTQEGGWVCQFQFAITLSNEAAERQAAITDDLQVVYEGNEQYLSEDIDLYLDDNLVDSLRIGAELKGQASTDIAISGSGTGTTQEAAVNDALDSMHQLQTILITGSLPVKLNFVKTDSVSPLLGAEFIDNAILVGLLAMLTVAVVIFIRYRDVRVVFPMALTMFFEVIMILGFAAVLRWNLDLAAIAGIIIVAGTSVDHLIVLTDSVLKGEKEHTSWASRVKSAFSVIMTAYLTTAAAMLFLFAAGAGLLKGFALTTILGVTVGVLIARPAYANVIKILLRKE
ncbi:MAG: hypothetical protein ACOC32_04385 [Nanoarchaeota archaeon]